MMKRFHALLLMLCLLCGCALPAPAENQPAPVLQAAVQDTPGLYDPDSALEAETNGAVRCYPLGGTGECGVYPLDDNRLLLITPGESTTALTILEGSTLTPGPSAQLSVYLSPSDPSVLPCGSGISFYDSSTRETVVLDSALQELRRIPAPKDALELPLLSRDGETLYYCTRDAIRALEVSSGISRILKRSSYPRQKLTGLLLEDAAIACCVTDEAGTHTLLLSTQTGATLHDCPGEAVLTGWGSRIYCAQSGAALFGTPGTALQALVPANTSEEAFFLPEHHSAVTRTQHREDTVTLSCYALDSGQRTAVLTLRTATLPWGFQPAGDGGIWFVNYDRDYGCNTLYLWDPTRSPAGDDNRYTEPHFTKENPDLYSLAACEDYARELGTRYGIEILVYQDADNIQPSGYRLEYEYLAQPIYRTLTLLEQSLQHYPENFLPTVAQRFDGLTLCLVRSIRGSSQWGTLDNTQGLQFWDDYHAYIALAVGESAEGALYHQLCHLIDTIVLNESSAYDTWQSLNPSGFQYDYSYAANQTRESTAYLQNATRSFVDMFSMSFPKEDRARIMEYAMLPGNEELFQSKPMQAKLLKLCQGIREAFGLKKSPETFLWEQYLNTSLAYTE